ncbi:MAG: CHASE2 domain-containing protein [Verrucomicrobia bacterium]|nr:CHASE2 domain-containing protein [Verrucomicrobiota bacterium]
MLRRRFACSANCRGTGYEFFRNRVVFVGAKPSAGFTGTKLEEFAGRCIFMTGRFYPGVEVHTTAFLNLLRQEWLRRLPAPLELALLAALGVVLGYGMVRLQPLPAVVVVLTGAIGIAATTWGVAWTSRVWFARLIVAAVPVPAAFAWSVVFNALQGHIQRRLLHQCLSAYVSEPLARQLLRRPELLQVGAGRQEVSVLFSDIARFSAVASRLAAQDLVALLSEYFEVAIGCVHHHEVTILHLLGDAIFAVWNAPRPQLDHRARACHATLLLRDRLAELDERHGAVLPMRTRIGVHTGEAYVGNFGTGERFNYLAIGESTNLASRLEGLNRFLGTEVLVSREALAGLEAQFVTCPMGYFRLKGFDRVVEIHELVGPAAVAAGTQSWREAFTEALYRFERRDFDRAGRAFRAVEGLRTQHGPSQFYLRQVTSLRDHPPSEEWLGEVEMTDK